MISSQRSLFSSEHEMFRDAVRGFVESEMVPHHAEWEKQQRVPRETWLKAGAAGLLCCDVPEQYGGAGADWLFNVVVIEELARAWGMEVNRNHERDWFVAGPDGKTVKLCTILDKLDLWPPIAERFQERVRQRAEELQMA